MSASHHEPSPTRINTAYARVVVYRLGFVEHTASSGVFPRPPFRYVSGARSAEDPRHSKQRITKRLPAGFAGFVQAQNRIPNDSVMNSLFAWDRKRLYRTSVTNLKPLSPS